MGDVGYNALFLEGLQSRKNDFPLDDFSVKDLQASLVPLLKEKVITSGLHG